MPTENEKDQQAVFLKLVAAMRKAQTEYYVHRISKSFHRMKKFERDVDIAMRKLRETETTRQLSL